MHTPSSRRSLPAVIALAVVSSLVLRAAGQPAVPTAHPRLLGSRADLQALAKQRPAEYKRMAAVARGEGGDDHSAIISMSLAAAIEGDAELAGRAKQRALKLVDGPIRKGHVTFGHDLALAALAYDLCHEHWTPAERQRFHVYVNKTVDANVQSETHVFHNAWYGYKHWGIGLAALAGYHENPRAKEILQTTLEDYRTRAAPALEMAGEGGAWAEGYYIHYWLYEWLFFCEAARRCAGLDLYAMAPRFYRHRAVASMFEMYPGISQYGSRRPLPMGDGGGRTFGGDRDKALAARRILVNYYRDDPAHQAVHAFNETTPRSGVGAYAYKDFLWRDATVPRGDLRRFKLSHAATGAGHVYARSSWGEDATSFFFKCSDRFTAHQHLDAGHFVIYRHAELAGDGGHYEDFGTPHDVNYHLRTIAHSTILVHDPAERWPGIRAGKVTGNDGGQHHNWPHHNGATADVADWQKRRQLYDTADLLAFEDHGQWLYLAADATRAYAPAKLKCFTRQIVYLRPGTFVVFDRVISTNPDFKKTWLLQAMTTPQQQDGRLVITNGKGRLTVQTLLPQQARTKLVSGGELHSYGGKDYSPRSKKGQAPECRIEVSPAQPAATALFLHVLTADDADAPPSPAATVATQRGGVEVTVGSAKVTFTAGSVGGRIVLGGKSAEFAKDLKIDEH